MNRVLTEAKVESLEDLWGLEQGLRLPDQARSIKITDAVADTRVMLLSLPTGLIRRLGLARVSSRRIMTGDGPAEVGMYDAVRLTILGRSCTMDVAAVPDGEPPVIGRIPLATLDLVVDVEGQTLIGNPAHGGEQILEL